MRFALAVATSLVTLLAMQTSRYAWPVRFVLAWDTGSAMLLAMSWWIIFRADADETRRRAAAEDPGRNMVWGISLVSSVVSIFAATYAIRHARTLPTYDYYVGLALALIAVLEAWAITHTSYALRYAHLYYRAAGKGEGLSFPGDHPPCDLDFAYFAFVIGMSFAVSDVTITSAAFRRGVLLHGLLGFFYTTVIFALTLNIVSSLVG
jgi:uncharacterized membrane protein